VSPTRGKADSTGFARTVLSLVVIGDRVIAVNLESAPSAMDETKQCRTTIYKRGTYTKARCSRRAKENGYCWQHWYFADMDEPTSVCIREVFTEQERNDYEQAAENVIRRVLEIIPMAERVDLVVAEAEAIPRRREIRLLPTPGAVETDE
jgi:hypothetical protein